MTNKQKQFDLLVYIGRFQPFHKAHQETIIKAQHISENVLVLVGTPRAPRSIKNPWTYEERRSMIYDSVPPRKLYIEPINDYTYDNPAWIEELGNLVNFYKDNLKAEKIGVIGYEKDSSSSYLNFFPQWEKVQMEPIPANGETIDATKIRELIFSGNSSFIWSVLPTEVSDIIERMIRDKPEWYLKLLEEYNYVQDYKRKWSGTPFPNTFVTVDIILVQSGHIALVERGGFPGKGQLALPGGFVGENERLQDAAIRELREEIRIKVPEKVLKGSVKYRDIFDEPGRSTRGRTITTAFLIHLDDAEALPKIKGSDDAKEASWYPLCEFSNLENVMYEDHYYIARKMLSRLD